MTILTQNCTTIPADLETPVGLYLKVRDLFPQSAFLESSDYHDQHNAMSFIGIEPIGYFKVHNECIETLVPGQSPRKLEITGDVDVVTELRRYMDGFEIRNCNKSLTDGLFGYTAYDAVRYFEDVDIKPHEDRFSAIPDIYYILYRYVLAVDHYKNEMHIVENCPENEKSGIPTIISILHNNNMAQYPFKVKDDRESSMTDEDFIAAVEKCISHARRGDVFQIVPSRRYSQGFAGDEFNVYRALRCINPSPYLFYFDFGAFKVFGSSPETHLRIVGKTAYIDPIAGTFRRTGDDTRDREIADRLLADPKENAEHIMLVDLARNDLSRSGGKVEIDFLKEVQFYSHVIHLVSRVKAMLPDDADPYRLFASTFPAGTLSGAPKVRAMQIIDEVEPHSRMLYGGCIGYLGFNGDINQAITIRSFLSYGKRLYSQAGAGIVARSNPQSELQETKNKLGALSDALKYAESFGK